APRRPPRARRQLARALIAVEHVATPGERVGADAGGRGEAPVGLGLGEPANAGHPPLDGLAEAAHDRRLPVPVRPGLLVLGRRALLVVRGVNAVVLALDAERDLRALAERVRGGDAGPARGHVHARGDELPGRRLLAAREVDILARGVGDDGAILILHRL